MLAVFLAIASLLPLVRQQAWWIRAFDFPRLQVFLLGVPTLALIVLFAWPRNAVEWSVAGFLGAALILQGRRILVYTPLAPRQVLGAEGARPDRSVSLLVANVLMRNRDADRLLAIIRARSPDLILTLEPDAWWAQQLRSIEVDYPHSVKEPLDNRYGMMLHSRLELVEPRVEYLLEEGIPSIHTRVRLPSGDLVWLHGLHPEPPSPTEADSSTPRDAELLIVGREVGKRDAPTIVAGDLNDVAWSHTTTLFQKISGLLDPRRGRGMFNTFHADYVVMRWPLDHVFHSAHFTLVEVAREAAFGSDHFPVFVKLYYQPDAWAAQEELEADENDRDEAKTKIEQAKGGS